MALRITTLHADLAHYRKVLSQQARTDPLTGLHNRLKLAEDLEQLHARSKRYAQDYCVAMCDVDNFKSYNDIYGHQAGDIALRAVAAALPEARQTDGVYRYGGEEFLLVLPNQTRPAPKLMERAGAPCRRWTWRTPGIPRGADAQRRDFCLHPGHKADPDSSWVRPIPHSMRQRRPAGTGWSWRCRVGRAECRMWLRGGLALFGLGRLLLGGLALGGAGTVLDRLRGS